MSLTFYYILHVFSGFLLAAFTFQAFAAPPERRKRLLMLTGITSVVMLVAGFGLLAKANLAFATWVVIKLVCWFGLSALAGMAFRRPILRGPLTALATLLILAALWAVYAKPG